MIGVVGKETAVMGFNIGVERARITIQIYPVMESSSTNVPSNAIPPQKLAHV